MIKYISLFVTFRNKEGGAFLFACWSTHTQSTTTSSSTTIYRVEVHTTGAQSTHTQKAGRAPPRKTQTLEVWQKKRAAFCCHTSELLSSLAVNPIGKLAT